jgi:hypothetical protein
MLVVEQIKLRAPRKLCAELAAPRAVGSGIPPQHSSDVLCCWSLIRLFHEDISMMISSRARVACLSMARWLAPTLYSDGARTHGRAPWRTISGSSNQVAHTCTRRCCLVDAHADVTSSCSQARKQVIGAKKKGWIVPPPEVVRSDILSVSLHKQKQTLNQKPPSFNFKSLDEGNDSNVPVCNWSTKQREWLVECLNAIFENCVVRSDER